MYSFRSYLMICGYAYFSMALNGFVQDLTRGWDEGVVVYFFNV